MVRRNETTQISSTITNQPTIVPVTKSWNYFFIPWKDCTSHLSEFAFKKKWRFPNCWVAAGIQWSRWKWYMNISPNSILKISLLFELVPFEPWSKKLCVRNPGKRKTEKLMILANANWNSQRKCLGVLDGKFPMIYRCENTNKTGATRPIPKGWLFLSPLVSLSIWSESDRILPIWSCFKIQRGPPNPSLDWPFGPLPNVRSKKYVLYVSTCFGNAATNVTISHLTNRNNQTHENNWVVLIPGGCFQK